MTPFSFYQQSNISEFLGHFSVCDVTSMNFCAARDITKTNPSNVATFLYIYTLMPNVARKFEHNSRTTFSRCLSLSLIFH